MENLKKKILDEVRKNIILDTHKLGVTGKEVHGCILSLASRDIIEYEKQERYLPEITEEGKDVLRNGSHEFAFYSSIPDTGLLVSDCASYTIGKAIAFKKGWVKKEGNRIFKARADVVDEIRAKLQDLGFLESKELEMLRKRKLLSTRKECYYIVRRGKNFDEACQDLETEITSQMVVENRIPNLKPFNFSTYGTAIEFGSLHPLKKMMREIKEIFLCLGFTEMDTSHYIDTAFWNFDVLFQSQSHPARSPSDTFYVNAKKEVPEVPKDYFDRVQRMHEAGGLGSVGHRSSWSPEEAMKLVLRTHTTSESARNLSRIAKGPFRPRKLFSIDKVFRNESADSTHLSEFHQIEGLIIGKGLRLEHLMGILEEFYVRMGLRKIKFKPAYNPYTEPSMEVFAYHEGMNTWMEVGNSGIFRPEMLRPMGFDEDVRVIAWGLSLERPAMIKYNIKNIKELLGHRVDIDFIRKTPICSFK